MMVWISLAITLVAIVSDEGAPPLPEPTGTIQGVVIDGTNQGALLEGVEVVLRAGNSGAFMPVAETRSDRYGKFFFHNVPLDSSIIYLPGANREGVHYPGQRVRFGADRRVAQVKLVSYAANHAPNPLIAERHDFEISVEDEAIKVTETLTLVNPTRRTYVGEARGEMPPVTFRLSVPEDFDRVTFDEEFYGRRFVVVDHRPVTDIPWLPGRSRLRYTYHVPLAESGSFRRTLDVATYEIQVQVLGMNTEQITCNLPTLKASENQVVFASSGEKLPESFEVSIEFGAAPVPWARYGRWGALLVLILSAAITVLIHRLRSGSPSAHTRDDLTQRRAA